MTDVKLSFGEQVYMRSVLAAVGAVPAGALVSFNHMEGRAVSGLAKKGFLVRTGRTAALTTTGAAWLAGAAAAVPTDDLNHEVQ
ncbi:hypothetical protein [Burkholderia ubonensis]|uniref:hypothetical protein n=1 Tax=Burkholderia ubonensis TaxID=101571 RepID=UPI00075A2547|nr:hypothetical protein [Burkholderia ubonensis]KVV07342.1 hypothetical protein WK77_16260 [Burkholderia ubonensis]